MILKRGAAIAVLTVTVLFAVPIVPASAADKWIEVKSQHVTVISRAGASSSRKMAWQVEQIRSAITKVCSWARVDLDRPLVVFAVDDEEGMRALVPEYWERRGLVHPASVWVTGADHYYLAIRADLETEDRDLLNPYQTAFFSYASLILHRSIQTHLPEWLSRGLAGVLSNTIVRDTQLFVGAPIPWHLRSLREGPRYKLATLLKMTHQSPELKSDQGLSRFDAQTWALVHFLMFADNAARKPKLDQFFRLAASGTDSDAAFREALGSVEALENDFLLYVNRSIFSYGRLEVDASVKRESFPQRALSSTEVAMNRARLHVAMGRPIEARAAIAEVRKSEPASPETYVAEGLLLDRENKRDEARDAFARAVDGGSTSAYAHYRLANLRWTPNPDRDTLAGVEKLLARTIALNTQHASGYAQLAEVRSALGIGDPFSLVARAVQLEPADPDHRLTAARILWRQKQHADALKAVEAALTLSTTDEERGRAKELQARIERDKPK